MDHPVRENKGLDIAAYRQALLSIGWSKLAAYDEVICLNDITILGPVFPFSEMFETMDGKNALISGASPHIRTTSPSARRFRRICNHIGMRIEILITSKRSSVIETMPVYEDYAEATRKHEMTFTKRFADLGFTGLIYRL